MKSIFTFCALLGVSLTTNAQVIMFVETPESLAGNYEMSWSDPGAGWGSPDLNDPLNAFVDTLVLAMDGTDADSLCCDTAGGIVNASDVFNQIAVLYRGSCEFGVKALNAQNAGARAVIVINNIPGAPIAMGAGGVGANVTIPVIMITQEAAQDLLDEIIAGNVTAFIGSKENYYPNDIGMWPMDVVVPPATSIPSLIAADSSEFSFPLGSWVFNFGQLTQFNLAFNANIVFNLDTLYDQTLLIDSLSSGDSVWIDIPDFSSPNYPLGTYNLTYTVSSDSSDNFIADNNREYSFNIAQENFSYAALGASGLPEGGSNYRPSGGTGPFTECIQFKDPNASRLAAQGLYFSAGTGAADSLDGVFIESVLYEWQDQFENLNDTANFPAATAWTLEPIAFGEYVFEEDLQGTTVYSEFDNPVQLIDNQRYLFCVISEATTVYLGFGTNIDYDERINYSLEAVGPISDNGTWYWAGFGTDLVPSIVAKLVDVSTLNVEGSNYIQNTEILFPNPAVSFVQIPVTEKSGLAIVELYDMSGKLVVSDNTQLKGGLLSVDVSHVNDGAYMMRLTTQEKGTRSFKVIIKK